MKKITKKQIREVLSTYRNSMNKKYEMPDNLISYDCGFYIKNGVIKAFVFYKNEGIHEDVYNKRYEKIIHLKKYTPGYGTLKECVNEAYEEIDEWMNEEI